MTDLGSAIGRRPFSSFATRPSGNRQKSVGPVQSFHEICAFSSADMRFQALISAAYIIGTAALIGESVCRVVAIDLLPEPAAVSPLERRVVWSRQSRRCRII